MTKLPIHEILGRQLNTKFTLIDFPELFELELIEVTEPTVTPSQTYFSLYFLGGKEFMLPQDTYRLTHQQLGEHLFFLVPISGDAGGFKYEAVFNLLNEST